MFSDLSLPKRRQTSFCAQFLYFCYVKSITDLSKLRLRAEHLILMTILEMIWKDYTANIASQYIFSKAAVSCQ